MISPIFEDYPAKMSAEKPIVDFEELTGYK